MARCLKRIFILYLCLTATVHAADSLDPVFARMDSAAKTFKGLTADVSDTAYTAIVDDRKVETGTIKLLQGKNGTRVLLNLKGGSVISFDGHKVQDYNPTTNVVDEFVVAPNKVNQYLQLGFGATSAELRANYDVTYAGTEQIGSQQASHIILIPKSPETRRDLKQAELWIGDNGLAVQQKILRPDGDYQLMTYSNMKLGAVPEKDLELKLKPGAKIQKH
jgi:outer membrane lipoprotein-sorting protein